MLFQTNVPDLRPRFNRKINNDEERDQLAPNIYLNKKLFFARR